jgi:hypothetical protein
MPLICKLHTHVRTLSTPRLQFLKATTCSNLVQIKHMREFLASKFSIDVKKHLTYLIWTRFEQVMAF